MGLLDWLFGRKSVAKVEEGTPKELDLESSKVLVQRKIDGETKSFWPRIEKFHSDIKERNEEFKDSIENLKNAKPPEKIDEQILKIANTSKNTFIAKMSAISEIIKRDFSKDIGSFLDYHSTVSSMINQVNKETVKEFTSLNVAYSKETNNVVKKLREIKEKVDGFAKELNEKKGQIDMLDGFLNDIRTFEERKAENKKTIINIEQSKSELENSEKEKENLEKKLGELNQSETWKAYIQLTKEKENLDSTERKIIEEIVNIFASLDRILKKFAKLVDDDTIAFKNIDTLKKYIESPFDGLIQDTNQEIINSALKTTEGLIKEKKLIVDNANESLRIIDNLKSSKILESLAKKYHQTDEEIKNLKNQIDNHEYLKKKERITR